MKFSLFQAVYSPLAHLSSVLSQACTAWWSHPRWPGLCPLLRDFVLRIVGAHADPSLFPFGPEFTSWPSEPLCRLDLSTTQITTSLESEVGLYHVGNIKFEIDISENVLSWIQQDVLMSSHIRGWRLEVRKDEGLTGLCVYVLFLTWEKQSEETGQVHFTFLAREDKGFQRSCVRTQIMHSSLSFLLQALILFLEHIPLQSLWLKDFLFQWDGRNQQSVNPLKNRFWRGTWVA